MKIQTTGWSYRHKIIALWTTFLLGMLFHTQLALMPLFHGFSVATSHTHEYLQLSTIFWLMLGVFDIAMAAIIVTAFIEKTRYRAFHFGVTLVYTIINGLHFGVDIRVGVPSYQLFLMAYLFLISLLLNGVSYQWFRSGLRQHPVLSAAN